MSAPERPKMPGTLQCPAGFIEAVLEWGNGGKKKKRKETQLFTMEDLDDLTL